MTKWETVMDKDKEVVAKYQEDGGYYDNLTYFLENHNEFIT